MIALDTSLSAAAPAGVAGIGKPYRLPVHVAVQVAWTSIRVRFARALITVSSVVLAVAFLLAVAGESIANRAVYGQWRDDTAVTRQARAVRSLLERPRSDADLLEHIEADRGWHQWMQRLMAPPATSSAAALTAAADATIVTPARYAEVVRAAHTVRALSAWISALKPAYVYLLVRTEAPLEWSLHFDAPGRLAHLNSLVPSFKGQLLTIPAADLRALQSSAESLRSLLAAGQRAELLRLAQVRAAGGAEAVIDHIISAANPTSGPAIGLAELENSGLPLSQVAINATAPPAGDVATSGVKSLAVQLRRERDRARAALAVVEAQRGVQVKKGAAPPTTDVLAVLSGAGTATAQRAVARAVPDLTTLRTELSIRAGLDQTGERLATLGVSGGTEGNARTFWLIVLSLLVCIVGIVNTMMMAVTERFREIATMKCLGAPDSFILRIFLIEAVVLGVVGAGLGLVFGLALVAIQASLRFGAAFWQAVPVSELAITGAIAVATGLVLAVVGALLPAVAAARMHPIEAMRVET